MQPNAATVVDLFAGVGGLSLGFEMAGANVVSAVESNPHHVEAYKAGHRSQTRVITGAVEELSSRDILTGTNLRRKDLDVLIGGPPCQPFSTAGKRRGQADHRGTLVWHFVRFVGELLPRFFVMENVVGLRSIHSGTLFDQLIAKLQSHSYRCKAFVLNAADFGVPQHRRRLFLIGTRVRGLDLAPPSATNAPAGNRTLLNRDLADYLTVRGAIWDLRGSRFHKMSRTTDDSIQLPYYDDDPNEYQALMRGEELAVSGNGVTAHYPHILTNIRKPALGEGETENSTRYRRLYWDLPSFTLRAGSGSFTALRPIHPSQSRVITVREAARLQSFPDHIQFSPIKKWAYQQIGNSVPPLLSKAIANHLLSLPQRRER